MRLITTNEQLLALLPNIMTVVKGERQLIDKIVPFIDASEKCRSSEGRIEFAIIMLSCDSIALNEMDHL